MALFWSLPSIEYKDIATCSICNQSIHFRIATTKCRHDFCVHCLYQWSLNSEAPTPLQCYVCQTNIDRSLIQRPEPQQDGFVPPFVSDKQTPGRGNPARIGQLRMTILSMQGALSNEEVAAISAPATVYRRFLQPMNTLYATWKSSEHVALLRCDHLLMTMYIWIDLRDTIQVAARILYRALNSMKDEQVPDSVWSKPWVQLEQGKTWRTLQRSDELRAVSKFEL
ncbi:MAG: hypothetical protein Q9170_006322 [Blastenia crenularia]